MSLIFYCSGSVVKLKWKNLQHLWELHGVCASVPTAEHSSRKVRIVSSCCSSTLVASLYATTTFPNGINISRSFSILNFNFFSFDMLNFFFFAVFFYFLKNFSNINFYFICFSFCVFVQWCNCWFIFNGSSKSTNKKILIYKWIFDGEIFMNLLFCVFWIFWILFCFVLCGLFSLSFFPNNNTANWTFARLI